MKKKMGILGGLLMAVVVTGYSVAGTYAKYTSSLDFADEARVATWGFKLNGKTPEEVKEMNIDLFQDSYEITKDSGDYDVVSKVKGQKVVAPGTRGEYTFNLTGTAETNYVVAFNATIVNTIKTADYNPIFFRLNDGNWMNAEEFETYLNETITNDTNKVYAANEELNETYKIEWMWAFDADDTTAPAGFTSNDETDTYLAGQNGTVSLDVELTVTQSELAATDGNATRFAMSNAITNEGKVALASAYGYDATVAEDVVFEATATGAKLSGELLKSSSDVDTKFWGATAAAQATGYYYPVSIRVENPDDVTALVLNNRIAGTEKVVNRADNDFVDANGTITLFLELGGNGATSSVAKVRFADGSETTYTIDYSELTMTR